METRRWLNPSQPQTLQIAVFLLYINAGLLALTGGLFSILGLAVVVAGIGAGYGIANEKRWGYLLALAVAFLPFVIRLAFYGPSGVLGANLIDLMFEVALVALLLHPQSRDYQRVWFS